MSLYRCAFCGSPNVERSDRSEFSYKKGLVGTAVFGSIGAVAGINGKEVSVFGCHDCGKEADHPMDSNEKMVVETMLASRTEIPQYLLKYPYLREEIEKNKLQRREHYYNWEEDNDNSGNQQATKEQTVNDVNILLKGLNIQLPDDTLSKGVSKEELDRIGNEIGNALSGPFSQKGSSGSKMKKEREVRK